MKALIKKSIAALPLNMRLAIVRSAAAAKLDSVLPIPRAAHAVAGNIFRNWIANYIHPGVKFFAERNDMYKHLSDSFGNTPIAYYEFGVHQGRSLRVWTELNTHPDSRFYGFDSFEGLPEDWDPENPKGTFDVNGNMPVFEDSRVKLIKGWFNETLPANKGLFETSLPKIIHMDADLYSSTMTVFNDIGDAIDSRCVVIFDEFCDLDHEFRALKDYGRPYTVLTATSFFVQLAVRFIPRTS
jgi:hypothetical protein